MTLNWEEEPAQVARRLCLRFASARMHENIARTNLRDAISYYTTNSHVADGVSFEKLEPLVKNLAAIHDQMKAHLQIAREAFDQEVARRQKARIPLTGMADSDINAAGMQLAENLDLSAPTPLDEFLAAHRTVTQLFPATAAEGDDEDDDEQQRRRTRGR